MAEEKGVGKSLREETVRRACKLAFKAHRGSEKDHYLVEKRGSEAIFAFGAGSWTVKEWFVGDGAGVFGEAKIDLQQFPCLRSISNDELAKVNKAFLTRFLLIKEQSNLLKEVKKALDDKKQIVFTGHSAGGAVAMFATVWFFEQQLRLSKIQPSSTPHNCLTFGSPLAGDRIFCHAVRREGWSDHFVHFVMRPDIVPRVALAPPSSMTADLPEMLKFFKQNCQGSANLLIESSLLLSEFFKNVMRHASCTATQAACTLMGSTNMLMETISGFIELSPYRPFGTFVFCSGNGGQLVVKNPDAVVQILFYSLQLSSETEVPEAAKTSLNAHLAYEVEINRNLKMESLVHIRSFADIPLNSDDSIDGSVTLDHFGLSARARLCLRAAGELEKQKAVNLSEIKKKKDLMQKTMDEIEVYRSTCETRGGYYDSFRQSQYNDDFHANVKRLELVGVWDEVVEMLKRYELPEEFEGEKEWVELGTKFRRLVEPLDISNYYRHLKNEDTGAYLDRGRPRRYKYTQRWLEHLEQKPAGSCGESTFWAEVEELRIKTSGNEPFAAVRAKVKEIEENFGRWRGEGILRKDAFLEGSSLIKLWEGLRGQHPGEVQDMTGFISC